MKTLLATFAVLSLIVAVAPILTATEANATNHHYRYNYSKSHHSTHSNHHRHTHHRGHH